METDQEPESRVDTTPFWGVSYNNCYNGVGGNTYGGEATFMDVAGVANGIGRNGRGEFETWMMRNAAYAPDWRAAYENEGEGVDRIAN